jgi:hypothetical protein
MLSQRKLEGRVNNTPADFEADYPRSGESSFRHDELASSSSAGQDKTNLHP